MKATIRAGWRAFWKWLRSFRNSGGTETQNQQKWYAYDSGGRFLFDVDSTQGAWKNADVCLLCNRELSCLTELPGITMRTDGCIANPGKGVMWPYNLQSGHACKFRACNMVGFHGTVVNRYIIRKRDSTRAVVVDLGNGVLLHVTSEVMEVEEI